MDRKTEGEKRGERIKVTAPEGVPGTIVMRPRPPPGLDEIDETDMRKKSAYVWSWGKNKYGELSLGVTHNALIP
jgi:hypothetical protein